MRVSMRVTEGCERGFKGVFVRACCGRGSNCGGKGHVYVRMLGRGSGGGMERGGGVERWRRP